VRHIREAVRFHDGLNALTGHGATTLLELGPDAVLTAMAHDTLTDPAAQTGLIAAVRKDRPEPDTFLTALAQLHVRGTGVDWTPLYGPADARRRVDLPTYAFQHQHYWLEAADTAADADGGVAADEVESRFWETVESEDLAELAKTLSVPDDAPLTDVLPALTAWRRQRRESSALDRWSYRESWTPLTDAAVGDLTGSWLVVVPEGRTDTPWSTAVAALMAERGVRPVTVEVPGHATDRHAVAALLRAATADAPQGFEGVLSLLAADDHGEDDAAAPADVSLALALIQALGDTGVDAPLWCATRAAVAVGATDGTAPGRAALWGLGRVAALEYPERWGGLVDLPEAADTAAAARLARALGGAWPGEDQMAVRGSGAFGRRVVRAPLDDAHATGWTPRGTVLVTGGTGALGAHVARWLAREGAEHLVLTGRRGPDAPGAAELRAELEESGTRVTLAACDAADRDALARVLDAIPADAPLTAVFHAAGVLDDGVLEGMTAERFATVFRAKARSARNLDELTAGLDLSAFVLFSSFAGVAGGPGQGSYAAANAYLDGLAHARRARGLTATAVAWGPWAGSGMAAEGVAAERLRGGMIPPLQPDQAIAALHRLLAHDRTTALVADIDWPQYAPAFTTVRPSRLYAELPEVRRLSVAAESGTGQTATGQTPDLAARLTALAGPEQERLLLDLVCAQVAAVLGYSGAAAVEPTRAFRELGFDSLTAVELRNRVNALTGLVLPATVVFDHPTPTALADCLRTELAPDAADPATLLLGDLERLEGSLAAVASADEITRTKVAVRLQAALDRWKNGDARPSGGADESGDSGDVSEQLAAASDDEMLEFIKKQLGRG
ncbi:SDR family NAD(P)-dependent oxidoreductase, partial [Streptomyces spectabilis]